MTSLSVTVVVIEDGRGQHSPACLDAGLERVFGPESDGLAPGARAFVPADR